MSTPKSASIQARLLHYSRNRRQDHNYTLTRYGIERLMYRLSRSSHADQFVLKGAMLFSLWMEDTHRPTKDLDLLGIGDLSSDVLREIFREICETEVEDDGVEFLKEHITITEIREAEIYQGLRVKVSGRLANTQLNVSVDVGFGDAITPRPKKQTYPVLLDLPPPKIRTYPKETVVAKKLDAIIVLGLANSRMKDYFDLWTLATHFEFEGSLLQRAIKATLKRRGRTLTTPALSGLQPEFAHRPAKQTQWKAFLRRILPEHLDLDLEEVVSVIHEFLNPVLEAMAADQTFQKDWEPEHGWTKEI